MKSYAYWPVKLEGLDEELHVTAAFFGGAKISPQIMNSLIEGFETHLSLHGPMTPAQFSKNTYVLTVQVHPQTRILHSRLGEIRPHDFGTWRPHITVPKAYWDKVMDGSILPRVIAVGPLCLKEDGVVTHVWNDDPTVSP